MTKQANKNGNGCLWLILAGFFTIFISVFVGVFFKTGSTISLVIALVVAIFLTSKIVKPKANKSFMGNAVFLILFFFGIKVFGGFLLELLDNDYIAEEIKYGTNEGVEKTSIVEANDSIVVYQSNRVWKDNFGNDYEGSLTIREEDYLDLLSKPIRYAPTTYENYWGGLYAKISKRDSPSLDLVMKMFYTIHNEKQLNQMEFAEMVVSCIQDIPYSFVFEEPCQPASHYPEEYAKILRNCPECCIGGIPFGVQTPVNFLQNLKGDCDTRTILIYAILKYFNYDVAILNSDFYRHSILGLNIPSAGTYKTYRGKKYILWETTAKYYKAGVLPVSFKDVKYWNIVITSK